MIFVKQKKATKAVSKYIISASSQGYPLNLSLLNIYKNISKD